MYQTNITAEEYDKIKGAGDQMNLVSLANITAAELGFLEANGSPKYPVNTPDIPCSSPFL